MKTIPQIRERLFQLADEHNIPELAELAEQTRRRFNGRKAKARAPKIDDLMASRVRVYAYRNREKSLVEIGRVFNINQGRVSEILFGKRGEAA